MMKTKKMTKLVTLLLALAMVFSLAACSSGKGKDKANGSADIAALIATEPNSADEAAKLYQQLMQKENDILAANSDLWNKVFLSANKNSTMIEDGTNYGDFLLATIESAKDGFSADAQDAQGRRRTDQGDRGQAHHPRAEVSRLRHDARHR